VNGFNINYKFGANQLIGYPDYLIDFAVSNKYSATSEKMAYGIMDSDKFFTLSKLFDQVRLKGMSVKMSYVTATGLNAQTLNLVAIVDRSATIREMENGVKKINNSEASRKEYKDWVDNASSRRKISLTGGKTAYFYYRASSTQEKQFLMIDENRPSTDSEANYRGYIKGGYAVNFDAFNPCIYTYIEKSAAAETNETTVTINVEVKYYIEFRNSV